MFGEMGAFGAVLPLDMPIFISGSNDLGDGEAGVAAAAGGGTGDAGVVAFMKPNADPLADADPLAEGCTQF